MVTGLLLIFSEMNEADGGTWLMVIMSHENAKIKATASPKMNKIRFKEGLAAKCSLVISYTRTIQ